MVPDSVLLLMEVCNLAGVDSAVVTHGVFYQMIINSHRSDEKEKVYEAKLYLPAWKA